jgi:drug/metabolite transporter (DMT)-like permease
MSSLALALVLIAAVLHATWNLIAKRAGGDVHFPLLCALGVAVLWAPAGAAALWLSWHDPARPLGVPQWTAIAVSAVLHIVYFHCLLRGYRESDLSVVYPVARGTGPLLTVALAVLLLHEQPGPATLAGALAISAGIVLLAGGPALWRRLRGGAAQPPEQRQRVRAGVRWGATTGVLIAGYTVVDGYAVTTLALMPVLVDYFANLLRVPMLLPLALRDRDGFRRALRRDGRAALMVAALSPLAYVLVLQAATMAPLSHVAPAREVSMLFAAWLGGRWLGEGERGWRMAGAACLAAGVVALAL